MKYTKEELESMPRIRLRKVAMDLGIDPKLGREALISSILAKDGCDHDCSHCDNIKPLPVQDLSEILGGGAAQIQPIDIGQMVASGLQKRYGKRVQPVTVLTGHTMADIAQQLCERQQQPVGPDYLIQMLEAVRHPKLRISPFWKVEIEDDPAGVIIYCLVDPLVFEAAGFTVRELKTMMETELRQLLPYLPQDRVFSVRIEKQVKQLLGTILPRPNPSEK